MAPIDTDALVIGAGPVGLFTVFELGLQGICAHVVDSLPEAGGQCIELYPDKPIYDIPALPVCTGRELVDRLLKQIAPFAPVMHLAQEVSELERRDDGRFHATTSAGTRFTARSVFIAGGVGSFQPKRLRIDALAPFEGTQLRYRPIDAAAAAGQRIVIVGAGDAALDAAITLAPSAASVTLLHRREVFDAAPERIAAMQALREAGAIRFIAAQITGADVAGGRLNAVDLVCSDESAQRLPLDLLLVFQGLSPKLGPIANWSLALERKQLVVDPGTFETSIAGIHAVGDVNTYPGKRKLIVCGFHEATLAAFAAAERLFPERAGPLQYTTSSATLQRRLGVLPAPA